MKIVRIIKADIGNWDMNDEVELPDALAAQYASEAIGEIIPKRTKPRDKPKQTLQEVIEKTATAGSKT